MSETPQPQLEAEYSQLESKKAEFDEALKAQNIAEAKRLRQEIDSGIETLSEKVNPLERKLGLKEQYVAQKEILSKTGILEKLASGALGIKAIDGKEYPLPTLAEVNRKSKEKRKLLETKEKQGLKKMLLVPFGKALQELKDAYGKDLIKHHQEGKLLATNGESLELDTNNPVWQWDQYQDADKDGKLVYDFQEFSSNHQGKTKQELIDQGKAWRIIILEDQPDLPAQGQAQEKEGRRPLEADQTPNQYLEALKTDPQYQGEQGLTPESWLAYAITRLEEQNQVIDDWQGLGKACCLTGAFFPASVYVSYAYWNRDNRQAYLYRSNPANQNSNYGVRSSVEI